MTLSTRDTETLRALSRQERPSTGAEIGRRLKEFGVIDNYARAHQLLDGLRVRGYAASEGERPQRWTITPAGRQALAGEKLTLQSVLAEYGVSIVHPKVKRRPWQSHAESTLVGLWNDGKGEAHLRDVLVLLTTSENNAFALERHIINATSRLLKAHPDWWEQGASKWLDLYDEMNLVALDEAVGRTKAVSKPAALTAEIYRRLATVFEASERTLFGDRV